MQTANLDPLTQLGEKYGTDKVHDHWYTPHYHQRFHEWRDTPVRLLEIGVGGYHEGGLGGESLRMWRDYFTCELSVIVGMDIEEKAFEIPGVHIVQGDQSNPADLRRIGDEYGPFDIIVDDGSHKPNDILQSWVVLFPEYLAMGGWYCIEDLQASYWPPFEGSSVRTGDTVIGFLSGLIDRIHFAELDVPAYTPNRFDLTVVEMDIVRNLAFIRKGDNDVPSTIMPRHPHSQVWPPDAPTAG